MKEIDLTKAIVPAFSKRSFSMLCPEVESHMTGLARLKSVALFGIESHVCVLQTAMDLIERQYEVHLICDGTSSCRASDRVIAFEVCITKIIFNCFFVRLF